MRTGLIGLIAALSTAGPAGAQNPTVQLARTAFADFDFPTALRHARQAVGQNLDEADLVDAYEILGYSFGALDSADQAVRILAEMILLDPEREPDEQMLPPRLVSLFNQALGQVLVVRHVLVDSATFVAGSGYMTLRYEVSRPAMARLTLISAGRPAVIDSQRVNPGRQRFDWPATSDGQPIGSGTYHLIVEVADGRNTYQAATDIRVSHAPLDSLTHIDRLEGFDRVPETRMPPRDWRPLGVAALLAGAGSGAALALSNADLSGGRTELVGVGILTLGAGIIRSLRRPDAQVIPEAVLLNSLIRQQVAETNRRIAQDNEELRRRVRLTIVQVRS